MRESTHISNVINSRWENLPVVLMESIDDESTHTSNVINSRWENLPVLLM